MISSSLLPLFVSAGTIGLAFSAGSELDWETGDDDYESPFADEDDEPLDDPSRDEPTGDSPFSSPEDAPSSEPAPSSSLPDASPDAGASSLTAVEDARALCNEAMDHLHADNPDRAFDRLSAHWAFSQDELDQLQQEVQRTRAVVADRYGDSIDYHLLHENTAGDVLARFAYLERFERHGLRWRFTFYRGGHGWSLNDVYFDDEIEALLG